MSTQEMLSSCRPSTVHASDELATQFVETGIPGACCIIVRTSYLEAVVVWLLQVRGSRGTVPISVILPAARSLTSLVALGLMPRPPPRVYEVSPRDPPVACFSEVCRSWEANGESGDRDTRAHAWASSITYPKRATPHKTREKEFLSWTMKLSISSTALCECLEGQVSVLLVVR